MKRKLIKTALISLGGLVVQGVEAVAGDGFFNHLGAVIAKENEKLGDTINKTTADIANTVGKIKDDLTGKHSELFKKIYLFFFEVNSLETFLCFFFASHKSNFA